MTVALVSLAASALLVLAPSTGSRSDEGPMLIRNLSVSSQSIVFSYAGDLWRVGRQGGTAEHLTSGPDEDDYPVFSKDGLSIAFSRRGADDWDVYFMPAQGGEPTRLTYNPEADIARGWNAGGDTVIFMSHRDEELVFRLYAIPRKGGFPTALALPRAWDVSPEPKGERLAYVPVAWPGDLFGSEWRHYRGGMTSSIDIVDLGAGTIEPIPRDDSNDRDPEWLGDAVYFVSDRSGTFNLHRYDQRTGQVEQLTSYQRFGVESVSGGGGVLAFVQDGHIHAFDPATGEIETIEVRVEPDRSESEPRAVSGETFIESAAPSPSGDQVLFGMRGDVVRYDVGTGDYVNLTGTSGTAERYPVMSPDGKQIAYFSDQAGEYHLYVRPADGDGPVTKIPIELQPSFYRELVWSPDSRRIAFSDKELTLWVADVETGGARRITTSSYSDQGLYQPAWSPDGVWLAYSRYESNRIRAVYLYHAGRGRRVQVTDGRINSEHPVFDPSGKYLYFLASNTAPLGEFGWSVLSGTIMRPLVSRSLQVVVLRDGLPAPVFPVIGRPNPARDSLAVIPEVTPARNRREFQQRPPPQARRPAGPPSQEGATIIDLRDIDERIVPLPLPAMDYAGLTPAGHGKLYVLVTEWPDAPGSGSPPSHGLYTYDLSQPKHLEKLIDRLDEFSVTADRSKILYRRGRAWHMVPTGERPEPESGRLDLTAIELEVDPAAEWRQIYHEAWRLMDDYFYDPNHHGQNVAELEQHYAGYLPSTTRRRDLNLLLGKGLGHVSVSHLRVSGGDMPPRAGERSRVGLLGADYAIEQGLYRITRIYHSGPYSYGNPLLSAPLDQPGVYVQEGDYLLAVDGEEIAATRNLYSYFQGKALTPVQLTVTSDPEDCCPHTYTVVPLPGENSLRRWNWAERNRRTVAEESQGILGYIYVPNFSYRGLQTVYQQLLESVDKRGLIIDQRFSPGGITSDYLIEWLKQSPLYYYTFRHGDDLAVPTNPLPSSKVLLINDVDASAAETFALMFKLGKVGRIVGTRTAGAGIGPYAFIPRLIDGGRISIPSRAAFNPAGTWEIENQGVRPDVEAALTLADWWEGRDAQLGAAIKTVLQMIVNNPPLEIKKPEYPVYP